MAVQFVQGVIGLADGVLTERRRRELHAEQRQHHRFGFNMRQIQKGFGRKYRFQELRRGVQLHHHRVGLDLRRSGKAFDAEGSAALLRVGARDTADPVNRHRRFGNGSTLRDQHLGSGPSRIRPVTGAGQYPADDVRHGTFPGSIQARK